MVKENQLVTGQLGDSTQEKEEARRDADAARASLSILQQTVKARDLELRDIRAAYENLAAEARHGEASISQLKRQLGGSVVELEGAKAEIVHAREAAHSSQQLIQQYVVDVQALERNSDTLARELQTSKAEAEELSKDRTRVLEQMQLLQVFSLKAARNYTGQFSQCYTGKLVSSPSWRGLQGMRYEAERSRDNLQQEVARLDSQLHIAKTRLEESHSEIRKMTEHNSVLQNRIREFETLTETMREKEFSMSQLVLQRNEDGSEMWKVKTIALRFQDDRNFQNACVGWLCRKSVMSYKDKSMQWSARS